LSLAVRLLLRQDARPMMHRAGSPALALVLLLLPAAGKGADTGRHAQASLEVARRPGAESCLSESELRRAVTEILGYASFQKSAHRKVTCLLSASGGEFHARIELKDTRTHKRLGVRELSSSGASCEALGPAVALAIALAIDPLAQPPAALALAVRPVPPAPATSVATPPDVSSGELAQASTAAGAAVASPAPMALAASASKSQATPTPRAPPRVPSVALSAVDAGAEGVLLPMVAAGEAVAADSGTGTDAGVLAVAETPQDAGVSPLSETAQASVAGATASAEPASSEARPYTGLAGAGADVTVGLVPSTAFGVVAHGGLSFGVASVELEARWLPTTTVAFDSGSISSWLLTAGLVGCATFGDFSACGLVETGPFTSQGKGLADAETHMTWVVELGARGQWDWVFVYPVGLRLHVDGLVNLVRPRLLVGTDVAWKAPSVALAAGVGLFVVF
jgi:hypothetical protein